MKTALIFLALVALSQAGVPLSRDLSGRIVNGEPVKPGAIPYQVSIQNRGSNFHFCGGSVLNEDYVLTAAHCVEGKSASSIQIIAGTVNLDDPKSVHLAEKIIMHEQYNPSDSWKNDIALIKVDTPFVLSQNLKYVPLPKKGLAVPAQSLAIISGWGRLWEGGDKPKKLQHTRLIISTNEYCSTVYSDIGYTIHASHICANDPDIATGACHGDSGGPLTVNGKIVGIASWTNGCASKKYPTVYTRVPDYIDWINEHAV